MIIISFIKIFFIAIITLIFAIIVLLLYPIDFFTKNSIYNIERKLWGRVVMFIAGMRVEVQGMENIEKNKQYVVVGNHLSQMDIPPILAYFPGKLSIIYKKELEKVPIFGWILRLFHIRIDRNSTTQAKKDFEKAKNKIENKNLSVMLFPEGTRSKTNEIQKFKKGAFVFSIQTQIDILPFVIYGTKEILSTKSLRLHSGIVYLKFCKPISTKGRTISDRNLVLDDTRNLMIQEFEKLKNQ